MVGDNVVRLEGGKKIRGKENGIFPIVHISKLMRLRELPGRQIDELAIEKAGRVDIDECLMPEDSWVLELKEANMKSYNLWRVL